MKPGKVVDKTKGPVKVGPAVAPTKKVATKGQARMGHAKVKQIAPVVLCGQGHPVQIVHYNLLRTMRKWCPTCQETV